jgi:hypothetical protein
MRCEVFQYEISERLDQELSLPLRRELDQHLGTCPACRMLYQDLQEIRTASAQLDFAEPSREVWVGIEAQLRAEGLLHSQWNWRSLKDLIPTPLGWGFKPILAGAMLTLMILLSAAWFYRTPFQKKEPPLVAQETETLRNLQLAETQYQQAIQAMEEISRRKMRGMNPQIARIFEENLATMDYYLKECQEAVKSNPDNPLAQNYLLATYQKKVELLETLVNSDLL